MSFALATLQQAAAATRRVLAVDGASVPSDARFEILRATIWSLAPPPRRLHVTRVLGSALPAWRLLSDRPDASDEALRMELRESLSTLQDSGDLIESSGGYWASATARFVRLPAGRGHMLVGGVPTALLPAQHTIQYHGPHRHVPEPPKEFAALLPIEDLVSWASLPDRDVALQDWAQELLGSLERRPYSPTSAEAFEFYLPAGARPGTPQFKRWSESPGSTTGSLLARRMRLYGAREYRLVEARSGRIESACDLHGVDVRRLMYALDLAAGNPVRARSRPLNAGTEWLFTSELPRAEQRVFAALGTLTIPVDRPFERKWTFVRHETLALELLCALGVQLTQ